MPASLAHYFQRLILPRSPAKGKQSLQRQVCFARPIKAKRARPFFMAQHQPRITSSGVRVDLVSAPWFSILMLVKGLKCTYWF